MKEVKRLTIINTVIDKKRTVKEAATLLSLSERQIKRLIKKVRLNGNEGIKHGNKQYKPKHALTDELKLKIINLKLSDKYIDTNYSHFRELLEEFENISISYTPLYNILKSANIYSKRKHKDRRTHRRRKRKLYTGDLVQADGTPFDWFNIGTHYSLHGFIDDATGNILGLYMCENECLLGYLEVTRQMIINHGIPKCLYPDKFSVFFPNKSQKITIEEELEGKKNPTTQFMNIMKTLGIDMFPASTSQAKGRIERLWNTLQDRLTVEFKLNNISSIEEANRFLINFIKKYNKKFAIEPIEKESHFSSLPDFINLDLLLTSHLTRVIDNAGTFTINKVRFQILDNKILPNVKVDIYISKKNGIIVYHNETIYNVICYNDIPSNYSTLTLNKLFNLYRINVVNFANSLLSEDAKKELPLLTSS